MDPEGTLVRAMPIQLMRDVKIKQKKPTRKQMIKKLGKAKAKVTYPNQGENIKLNSS